MTRFFIAGIAALFLATGAARADDFESFPEILQGGWCISLSESTETRIILHPEDSCEHNGGLISITTSRYFGSKFDCGLDTLTEIEPAKQIEERSAASALYHVYGACASEGPAWTDFTIQRIDHFYGYEEDEDLVINLSTQG